MIQLEEITNAISQLPDDDFTLLINWFVDCAEERLIQSQTISQHRQELKGSLDRFQSLDAKEKVLDTQIQAHKQKLKAKGDPFADLL